MKFAQAVVMLAVAVAQAQSQEDLLRAAGREAAKMTSSLEIPIPVSADATPMGPAGPRTRTDTRYDVLQCSPDVVEVFRLVADAKKTPPMSYDGDLVSTWAITLEAARMGLTRYAHQTAIAISNLEKISNRKITGKLGKDEFDYFCHSVGLFGKTILKNFKLYNEYIYSEDAERARQHTRQQELEEMRAEESQKVPTQP